MTLTTIGYVRAVHKHASDRTSFGLLALAALALLLLSGCSSADAAEGDGQFLAIDASLANCRAAPEMDAPVVTQFAQGMIVQVTSSTAIWSKVDWDGDDCWINNRLLADPAAMSVTTPTSTPASTNSTARQWRPQAPNQSRATLFSSGSGSAYDNGSYVGSSRSSAAKTSSSKRKSSYRSTRLRSSGSSYSSSRRRAPQRLYDSGGCPCSGSNICIGPRGGRYCITSGGNKRYGV